MDIEKRVRPPFAGRVLLPAGSHRIEIHYTGLRPGEKLVGTPIGASGKVRIEATAEPGP